MIHYKKIDFIGMENKLKSLNAFMEPYSRHLLAVYLFGSVATGDIKPLSDIDIAVYFYPCTSKEQMSSIENHLYLELCNTLGTDEIDLVNLNIAPLSMQYGALRNKKLIFCSNPKEVVDFESNTILRYLDFKPIYDEMNREFLNTL